MNDALANSPRVTRAGETFHLLPQRAIWWPAQRALLVADLHWGKDTTFRAQRIPLPHGMLSADLTTLSGLLRATQAERLWVLGDLIHARPAQKPEVVETVAAWRQTHAAVEMLLVEGNHDRHLKVLPDAWQIQRVPPPYRIGEIALVHEPIPDAEAAFTWAGHLHPMWTLRDRAETLRLPCFAVGAALGILPAFHPFTGGPRPDVGDNPDIFVIADEQVIAL